MAKEKSLVEEAIIQMKNLEEAVAENAKGILASTMKQEISELVKESLTEQDVEDEIETEINIEEPESEEEESEEESEEEESEEGENMDIDNIDIEEPIDLTNASDEEVLRVFQLMGPEDDVIVKKDESGNIHLKDDKTSKEYMIVGEGDEESYFDDEESEDEEYEDFESEEDFDDEESDEEFNESIESIVKKVFDEKDEEESEEFNEGDVVYEIEFNEEEEEEMEEENPMMESKGKFMTSPKTGKGISTGSSSEFKYKKSKGGFKEDMKQGTKGVGMGKAKFEFKEEAEIEEPKKLKKDASKEETKEASRTLGSGRRFGRAGLDKPKAAPRHLYKENEDAKELQILREKNEEYRKALNVFRQKLNEVAVFNSNLAYATRLFTEHTTSKQEKINILRRFDSVETIKESKNLYKTIKDEFSNKESKPINESIESKLDKAPSTGSAVNLIESKTYENPQFLRMKDLMSKLK